MTDGLGDVQLSLVDTVDDAWELMRWLSGQTVVAVDTETEGLRPERDRVRLIQVGGHDRAWAIPWEQWGGVFLDVVRRYEGEWVAHNMKFDGAMIEATCGVRLPRDKIHDTMIQLHVLAPHEPVGLKPASARYVDARAATASEVLSDAMSKVGWTWATVPVTFEPYWMYGALDTVLTFRLDELKRHEVLTDAPDAYDLERAVSWVVSDMERYGARVDVPFAREKLAAFEAYCEQVQDWCVRTYGVRPGSMQEVVERVFIPELGISREDWPRTKMGKLQLTKEILTELDHPLAKAILQRRQIEKVGHTYLRNFIELADGNDRIHPSINPLGFSERKVKGVRTSRMSMSDPNMQNLPRRDEANKVAETVRNCIIAREDHVLVMVDFDQIEYRLIASLSPDDKLKDAFFHEGEADFFTIMTRDVFGDPSIIKKDPRRQSVKNSAYALAYGAGPEKFAATAGVVGADAEAFLERFNRSFSGVRWLQNAVNTAATQRLAEEGTAYVRSPLTRRRFVGDRGREYAITNFLVQGMAAEIFKMKLVEAAQAGLDRFMVVPVHDEIVLDVPNEDLDAALVSLRDIMNDDQLLNVPITAGCAIGSKWGAKEDRPWPS